MIMAYITVEYCKICESATQHIKSKCVLCVMRREKEDKNKWDNLSVESKLNDLKKRIEKLEQGGIKFT
jgi:tRNA(Arg) A34 adenosine deaminase TadA